MLYFGTKKRWSKNKSIKELVQIPDELDGYVNDYKINVIEVAWLSDEQLKLFKSDFGIVANYFVQKRKNRDYIPDDKREIQHVDAVLKLLSVMTGDKRYEKILSSSNGEICEVNTMCEVVDRLVNMGKREGHAEGRAEGREEGRREELQRLVEIKLAKGKTVEQIADELEQTVDEVEELIQLFQI